MAYKQRGLFEVEDYRRGFGRFANTRVLTDSRRELGDRVSNRAAFDHKTALKKESERRSQASTPPTPTSTKMLLTGSKTMEYRSGSQQRKQSRSLFCHRHLLLSILLAILGVNLLLFLSCTQWSPWTDRTSCTVQTWGMMDRLRPVAECSDRGLQEIPATLPLHIEELHLEKNHITSLDGAAIAAISSLRVINLDENDIHHVASGDLTHLSGLRLLSLSNNNLAYLPALSSSSLAHLVLDGNPLTLISNSSMAALPNLWSLSVSHLPNLVSIETAAFRPVARLRTLLVTDNPRFVVTPLFIAQLCQLTQLQILHISIPDETSLDWSCLMKMPFLLQLELNDRLVVNR